MGLEFFTWRQNKKRKGLNVFFFVFFVLLLLLKKTTKVCGFLHPCSISTSTISKDRQEYFRRHSVLDDYEDDNMFSETGNNESSTNANFRPEEARFLSSDKKLKREVLNGKKIVLKGKDKRELRALANQMKAESALHTIQQSINNVEKSIPTIEDCLTAHKLVNIKVIGGEVKKKMVKEIAEDISERTGSQIIQVVGHTYLLYKGNEDISNPFIEIR